MVENSVQFQLCVVSSRYEAQKSFGKKKKAQAYKNELITHFLVFFLFIFYIKYNFILNAKSCDVKEKRGKSRVNTNVNMPQREKENLHSVHLIKF